jgi:hypothetical protein
MCQGPLLAKGDCGHVLLRYPFEKLDLTHDFSFACRRRHCGGLVRTVPRKGFRFVGDVTEAQAPSSSSKIDSRTSDEPSQPALFLPNKPSIAVLPFQNLSGDPEQAYFADGVVEDIITALSRLRWLFVIRNSSFTYQNRTVDVRQIGQELSIGYLLEGRRPRPHHGTAD